MGVRAARDTAAGLMVLAGGAAGGWPAIGCLAGSVLKKKLVKQGDGLGKWAKGFVITTVATLGFGSLNYIVTSPGKAAQKDVQDTNAKVTNRRVR